MTPLCYAMLFVTILKNTILGKKYLVLLACFISSRFVSSDCLFVHSIVPLAGRVGKVMIHVCANPGNSSSVCSKLV